MSHNRLAAFTVTAIVEAEPFPEPRAEPQSSGTPSVVSGLPYLFGCDYRAAANAAGSGDKPRGQMVFGFFNLLIWLMSSSRVAKPAK